jgi:hypothetical protein
MPCDRRRVFWPAGAACQKSLACEVFILEFARKPLPGQRTVYVNARKLELAILLDSSDSESEGHRLRNSMVCVFDTVGNLSAEFVAIVPVPGNRSD